MMFTFITMDILEDQFFSVVLFDFLHRVVISLWMTLFVLLKSHCTSNPAFQSIHVLESGSVLKKSTQLMVAFTTAHQTYHLLCSAVLGQMISCKEFLVIAGKY